MPSYFMPDYMFDKFDDVTPGFLRGIGVAALLVDIDNTLAPYEQEVADERIINWVSSLRAAGIKLTLVSNNHLPRVEKFNAPLSLPALPDCSKPRTKKLRAAMSAMGGDRGNTAFIGDQILTDVLAAKRLGLRAILLPPIKDKTTLFFKTKRLIEKPFIRKFRKKQEKQGYGGEKR